MTPQHDL